MNIEKRSYLILILLALVFVAPGLSAYFFYTHPNWLGSTTTNKGVLLDPPVLLAPLGKPGPKWRLVLWSPAPCDATCITQLDKLARIRLALGRRLYDVKVQLVLGHQAPQVSKDLLKTLQDRDIDELKLSDDEQASMPVLQSHLAIFISNPDHYLVLAYQPTVEPGDIFNDIKQLLNITEKMRK